MNNLKLSQIEAYVRAEMDVATGHPLAIAHDFVHVDRVRGWALRIARGEGFDRLDLVTAAALLHDVGLPRLEDRSRHAEVSANLAAEYLPTLDLFTSAEIDDVVSAIRHHSDVTPIPAIRTASRVDALTGILREADTLDALGVVGLMRAFTSKHDRLPYDPADPKGATWGLSADGFTALRAAGSLPSATIIDQINLQIAIFDNLRSPTAQALGVPLVATMRRFVEDLAAQVAASAGARRDTDET